MVFGVSSHRAEHWFFMNGGRDFDSDVNDPHFAEFYGPAVATDNSKNMTGSWKSHDWTPRPDAKYLDDWLARCKELVDRYQPQLFWFDWWIEQVVFQPYVQKFAQHYYNRGIEWGKGVAINYKYTTFAEGSAVLDIERGQLNTIRPEFWQNDTSVSKNSWGYVENQEYKTAKDLIGDLVDVVSKNGALLLNIGPLPDGTIPKPEQELLLEIGRWLDTNGEAIYGTRPWKVYGEGPTEVPEGYFMDTHRAAFTSQDIRFTQKNNALYAICLGLPDSTVTIEALKNLRATEINSVHMLGVDQPLEWSLSDQGMTINPPALKPCDHAVVFKLVSGSKF
jgi:alpha-L-fucosidase